MTEAVEAVTDYWFPVLGFPVLRVPKAVANTASRRISEKIGMRVVSTGVNQKSPTFPGRTEGCYRVQGFPISEQFRSDW